MTLKGRISIYMSIAFSLIFGVSSITIYVLFSKYRKEEFKDRLEEKALTTAKLLIEVKGVDDNVLKLIDRNSIHKLYNEKTLVFDKELNLIYSSIDDASIEYRLEDLQNLKGEKSFFREQDEKEVLGIHYDFKDREYYVLIAAEDKYGYSKLQYLFYSLIVTYAGAVTIIWLTTNFQVRRLLRPLDKFERDITRITADNLNTPLELSTHEDEIKALTRSFNKLLGRLEKAFDMEKEFTANASHELRTPISRLTFQLDNLRRIAGHNEKTQSYLNQMGQDLNQMSEIINSLIVLARYYDPAKKDETLENVRIDEIVFSTYDNLHIQKPELKMHFEMDEDSETLPEVKGQKNMLEIAVANLMKNASQYSNDGNIFIGLFKDAENRLVLKVKNNGAELSPEEKANLFKSFMRGSNAQNITGSGLGLRITKRILDYHKAEIRYENPEKNVHAFKIIFDRTA